MTKLSVVIITKNQDWNIGRLIESVLRETNDLEGREVIVVDSASTDSTVARALQYGVGVFRLDPDQPLTPSAGRYVGFRQTAGEFVLFLDGDMELAPGWLQRAMDILTLERGVAVVTGRLDDRLKAWQGAMEVQTEEGFGHLREVQFAPGAGLYRRAVLDEVGSFNPYLRSDEEPELGLRIRWGGYRLLQSDHLIAVHYSDPPGSVATLLGRWRRGLFLGAGQNISYHLGGPLLFPYLRERGFGLVPLIGAPSLFACLGWSSRKGWTWLSASAVGAVAAVLAGSIYKRGFNATLYSVVQRLLIADGTVRGLFLPLYPPDTYPARGILLEHNRR